MKPSNKSNSKRLTLIALFFLAVVFSAAEAYIRTFNPQPVFENYTTASFGIPSAFKPNLNVDLSYKGFPYNISSTSRGLRNVREVPYGKPNSVNRILCIGGSIFAASGVNNDETFSYYLNTLLDEQLESGKFETINAGKNTWELADYFTFFKNEGYKYNPDLTIVYVHTGELTTMNFTEFEADKIAFKRISKDKVSIEIRGIGVTENLNSTAVFILKSIHALPFYDFIFEHAHALRALEAWARKNLVLKVTESKKSSRQNLDVAMKTWDLKAGDLIDWKTDYGDIKGSPYNQKASVIYSVGLQRFFELLQEHNSNLLFLIIPSPKEILKLEDLSESFNPFQIFPQEGFQILNFLEPLTELQHSTLTPFNFPEVIHWSPSGHYGAAAITFNHLIQNKTISWNQSTPSSIDLESLPAIEAIKKRNARVDSLMVEKGHDSFVKGIIYLNQKKYDLAEKFLKLTLEKKPNDKRPLWHLSRLYFLKEDFNNTILFVHRAFKAGVPVTDAVYSLLAKSFFNLNHFIQAEELFKMAIAHSNTNYGNHLYYAQMLFFRNRFEEALVEFKTADQLLPNNVEILSGLGGAYLKMGDKEKAIDSFESILKVHPKNLMAKNTLDYLRNN